MDSLSDVIDKEGLPKALFLIFTYAVIVFAIFQVNVKIHELGHIIPLQIFGCQISQTNARYLTGETGFSCNGDLTGLSLAIIGLGGPTLALLWGLLLFKADSAVMKFGALASFFYSVIPNLALEIPGSDMSYVVSQGGLPIIWGVLFYVFVVGIIAYEVISWIDEKINKCIPYPS